MADTNESAVSEAESAIEQTASQATTELSNAFEGALEGDLTATMVLVQDYVIPIATAFIFLIAGYFLAKFLSRIASSPVRKRVDETVGRFVGKLVFYSVMIFVLLGILGRFGISVASFAAVVAAAGFAIGLAFQGSLSNFAAGVLLLVFRPFKVGDFISAAGVTGVVDEIDLFTTTLNTLDHRRLIVPNSNISTDTIENITHHPERRVDVNVGVEYSADIRETRKVLSSAAEKLSEHMIEGDNRGYQVFLDSLGDSSVNWQVRLWAKTSEYWQVRQELTEAVKYSLDEAGIGIPFPQMDIHLDPAVQNSMKKVVGQ